MLAMYLAVLDDQSGEEQFVDVYNTYKPVSYTHLDVYKRQAFALPGGFYFLCKKVPRNLQKAVDKTSRPC